MDKVTTKIAYRCEKCKLQVLLDKTSNIRCNQCGYRILSKIRTKKNITYISR